MNKLSRYQLFDSLRGFAMIIMAIYHFCFDLNYYGLLQVQMNTDPFWLNFRAVIMTLFTGLVGVSFYLGNAHLKSKSYQKRLMKLLFCSVLISVATYFMFGATWTFFGILHFIFLVSLFGPLLIRWPWVSLGAGIGIVLLPLFYRNFFFFQPVLIISGLSPIKPNTEDFAPLAPWLGVVMIGVFIGYLSRQKNFSWLHRDWPPLSKLGHYSLIFYMTHQLVLLPLAWLIHAILD